MARDRFAGRVAFVTGAASGIGRALVGALAARGARVIAADRDSSGLREVEAARGAAVRTVELDVTDARAFARVVSSEAAQLGSIDYLFNNAGVALWSDVGRMTLAEWRALVNVNLWGVIHGIRAVYPAFVERRAGHIVNTASLAGLGPSPGMTAYATTKHAVVGLSSSLRAEAAGHGVRVSVVCPGPVATPIFERSPVHGLDRARLLEQVAARAMGAERCAQGILRGVERNRAVIVVGKRARLAWWVSRVSPALTVRLAARRMLASR